MGTESQMDLLKEWKVIESKNEGRSRIPQSHLILGILKKLFAIAFLSATKCSQEYSIFFTLQNSSILIEEALGDPVVNPPLIVYVSA